MSFLDDLIDFGSSAIGAIGGFLGESGIGSSLARSAITSFALNTVTKSINKDNESARDSGPSGGYSSSGAGISVPVNQGTRTQIDPDTVTPIPVLYGTAYVAGRITDAVMMPDNQTMWFCLTLCEKTGTIKSNNQPSITSFKSVWWNENKIVFQGNGHTVDSLVSADGVTDSSMSGLVEVYCYSGNSEKPVGVIGYPAPTVPAYSLMPNWTNAHMMNELVFALVKVTYNKEKNVTGLGNMDFYLSNSMKQPGDCLYDYMTNARYGAGISDTEINS